MTRVRNLETSPLRTAETAETGTFRPADLSEIHMQARAMQSEMLTRMVAQGLSGAWRLAHRLAGGLSRALRRGRARRATLAELSRLDDRMLRDIGVDPSNVEGAVDRLITPRPADSTGHLGDVVRHLDSLMVPLRRWDLSRRAAGEMARLPESVLADLGYVRGDMDWVPEELASRRLARRPANANANAQSSPHHAPDAA